LLRVIDLKSGSEIDFHLIRFLVFAEVWKCSQLETGSGRLRKTPR